MVQTPRTDRAMAEALRRRVKSLALLADSVDQEQHERAYSALEECVGILSDAARETENPIRERYEALDSP